MYSALKLHLSRLGALLLVLLAWPPLGATADSSTRKPVLEELNVILIVVDTLSSRYLGCYNQTQKNSPVIDRLAKEGALFVQSFSVAPWTKPSLASIFTGVMPSEHGITAAGDRLAEDRKLLGEMLKERGFRTAGFASHVYLSQRFGLAQGLDFYKQVNKSKRIHSAITSAQVSDLAIEWMKEKSDRPFFLFLHYFDPHFNYIHHKDFNFTSDYKGPLSESISMVELTKRTKHLKAADVEFLKNLYREEIAFTDHHIGRVIEAVKALGAAKNTLVVLTADHGEEFMEHGSFNHTKTLYDELLSVPLIFYLPGTIEPRQVKHPVTQLDIVPTLLSLSKRPESAAGWSGISLAPALFGQEIPSDRDLFHEVSYSSVKNRKNVEHDIIGIRSGRYKLLHDRNRKRTSLYDLKSDPLEQRDLSKSEPKIAEDLLARLKPLEEHHAAQREELEKAAPGPDLPSEEIKKLETLGYL